MSTAAAESIPALKEGKILVNSHRLSVKSVVAVDDRKKDVISLKVSYR